MSRGRSLFRYRTLNFLEYVPRRIIQTKSNAFKKDGGWFVTQLAEFVLQPGRGRKRVSDLFRFEQDPKINALRLLCV